MPQSLYVAGVTPRSGKSIVLLGLMEFLSRRAERVSFFRPVIRDGEPPDPLIHLFTARYQLCASYEASYGVTQAEARALVQQDRYPELLQRILEKYRALQGSCDHVLCAGTDFTGVSAAFELDFDADVANNLDCQIIPVINGQNRDSQALADALRTLEESLEERRCAVLARVVNRVSPEQLAEVEARVRQTLPAELLAYVLPELPRFGMPTVGEVARALHARVISGQAEAMSREVANYRAAAMELPHFLDYLNDGSLVITPGDRADIILGGLLADMATTYPQISALLLTSGFDPAPQVMRLLDGLQKSPVPILSVTTDTFTTATQISAVDGIIQPENERKIAAALGLMEARVDFPTIERRMAMTRSARVTPLMFEYELIQRAKSDRRHIVLPEGGDERILRAAEILRLREVVDLTLLGDPEAVTRQIAALGLRLEDLDIIDPTRSELREQFAHTYFELRKHKGISEQMAHDAMADVSYFGTMMVYHDLAHGMVSGARHTTQHTIRPAFEVIRTAPGCSIVSSVFLMALADRVLVYGDCAVNPDPTAEQLADIAISSAATAKTFGIEPRVAMLSYSTGASGKGVEVDKVKRATAIARELAPDLPLDGPMQYDAAVDPGVARSKMPGSEVAGRATVFIFPDLNTGNNTYKAVQRSAGAVAIGPVLQGLKKPVNDLSRGCTVTDIVNTVAITAIQAQGTTV